ncbi:glycosyltransferase family 2 protein [Streptomyces sp. TLI_171]|uniref:glycosyltransferase n=1 Tax=Streptomyces sp. TLI_171 TaxID=1938859 RepID=UPI000FF64F82|nr:glycosyltransferase family 2 protein [Streptomyces sp. TLI_171]RKE18826.1 cellulose synthase/poly-beta-1,6-N-acetylglucosamine synthase-like glycosyltransferase [Streptomyces sp. TLI_171]
MTYAVTVLIPAHDEADFIADAVESALAQTVRPVRVLVVADACTDDTAGIARRCGADVLEVHQESKPRSLNLALAEVTTEYVALLDADGYFASPDVLETCLVRMGEKGFGGVCMSVTPHSVKGVFQRSRTIEWAAAHRMSRTVESWHGWVAVLSGCAGVYRTDAVRSVDGWSTDSLCEDVELALKMNRSGLRAGFVPGAYVCVRDPGSWRVYWRQTHRWAAGWAQALYKHRGLFFRSWGFTRVFGAMLVDSALLASGYVSLLYHLATGFAEFDTFRWMGWWFLVMGVITLGTASLQIGIRRTLVNYPAYLLVGTLGALLSLWVMFREWVLGRHLTSWTGRQGRRTVITRMSDRRRLVLTAIGGGAGGLGSLLGALRHRPDLTLTGAAATGSVLVAAVLWHLVGRLPERVDPAAAGT